MVTLVTPVLEQLAGAAAVVEPVLEQLAGAALELDLAKARADRQKIAVLVDFPLTPFCAGCRMET